MNVDTVATITLDPARFVRRPNLRHRGRVEVWAAFSADGAWTFRRLEARGTPWRVTHRDFPGWSMLAGSLPKARRFAERQLHLDLDAVERGVA